MSMKSTKQNDISYKSDGDEVEEQLSICDIWNEKIASAGSWDSNERGECTWHDSSDTIQNCFAT